MAPQKKHSATISPIAKAATITSLLAGVLLVILLSFVSLDLGVLTGGILALCSFYVFEGRRHKRWEAALDRTLKSLRKSQDDMEENIRQHTQDIALIKTQLTGLRAVRTKESSADDMPLSKLSAEEDYLEKGDIIPAFLRPQAMEDPAEKLRGKITARRPALEPAALTPVANDEPFKDEVSLSDLVVRELLHTAVEKHKIDVFMQPIVRLPQRQVRFYEMFARIRAKPGIYLPAARYMGIAAQESLMIPIDKLLLVQSLQIILKNSHKRRAPGFFLNIEPAILKNAGFMQRLVKFVAQNRTLAPALIFEIRQSDFARLSAGEHKILDALSKLGCRASLDHVTEIPDDIAMLQKRNIRFIKLSANHMLAESATDKRFAEMMRRKRKLEANGIGVIVEKIESEKDLVEILDYNINYGQGYLFGKPAIEGAHNSSHAA